MNTPRIPKLPSIPSLAPLFSLPLIAAAAIVPGLGGCAPSRQITRVDPNTTVDINQQFNFADARMTYQHMVQDALARPWVDNFSAAHNGQRPVVVVGDIKNRTQEYIETKSFTTDIERELINSGKVRFVADKGQRDQIRDERIQSREWSRPETQKQLKAETGADFIMIGDIVQNVQRSLDGRSGAQAYLVNMEVIDLETNEKVWIGSHPIQKVWHDQ